LFDDAGIARKIARKIDRFGGYIENTVYRTR
jgi:hypothetical protein